MSNVAVTGPFEDKVASNTLNNNKSKHARKTQANRQNTQTSKQANNKSKAGWKKVVRLELVCAGKCGHTQALIVARDGMTGWTDRCILCALWKNTYRCVYTCNYILQYIKTDVFKVHLDDGSILSVLHVSYSDRKYIHTRSLVCVLITIYLY